MRGPRAPHNFPDPPKLSLLRVFTSQQVAMLVPTNSSSCVVSPCVLVGGGKARILLRWRRNPASSIFRPIPECNTLLVQQPSTVLSNQNKQESKGGGSALVAVYSALHLPLTYRAAMKYGLRVLIAEMWCSWAEWWSGWKNKTSWVDQMIPSKMSWQRLKAAANWGSGLAKHNTAGIH